MKIFNILFSILFVISALLQYNDPDPYLWIPIYMYGAVLCFYASRKEYFPKAYLTGIVLFLFFGIYLFFDKYGVLTWALEHKFENIGGSMKATAPWIEETREFFGLVILIFVLSVNYIISGKPAK